MRKITQRAVKAFYNGKDFKSGNKEVSDRGYFLHGNKIAEFDDNEKINITLANWNTVTTRERLNGLKGVSIRTKQGQAFINGKEWNGSWITI